MLDSVMKALPKAEITVFPNSMMSTIPQYVNFWNALKRTDLLIFGGGQEIQDHASVAFLVSGLFKIALAKALRKRVFCYAVGVGPVGTIAGRFLTRSILSHVDLITLRDEESDRSLSQLYVNKPRRFVTADPALALIPANPEDGLKIFSCEGIPESRGPRIAIAPRRWFHYRHFFLPMRLRSRLFALEGQKEHASLVGSLARTADHLVSEHKAQVVFVPMRSSRGRIDPGQDDDQVSSEIINRMKAGEKVFLLKGDYSPKELKAFLGHMDLTIGMRMHSLILSAMMGTPIVGIALSPKFKPFFEMIGQSRYLLKPEDVTYDSLREKIDSALSERAKVRTEIDSRRNGLRLLALSNAEYAKALLEKKR
jgi:polysaccharide pyruvyl transferase WcaK-like protein